MIAAALATMMAIPSIVLAPQIDFASAVPNQFRKMFWYGFNVYVRTASGKEEATGVGNGGAPLEDADDLTRLCGRMYWGYDRPEDLKLTLLDVEGDPIVEVRVEAYAKDDDGHDVLTPAPVVHWVPRVAPKVTRVVLAPSTRGGTPIARAASGGFAAAVSAVAAPELDFGAVRKKGGPRVRNVYIRAALDSGDWDWTHLPDNGKSSATYHLGECKDYRLVTDEVSDRVGVLEWREVGEDGAVTKTERVVGLEVVSYGPPPAVRWTFRPEARRLLNLK